MSVRIPKYRLHKGSGQALVQINGERVYLGKHGTEESKEKYRRIVAEWLSTHRVCSARQPELSVGEDLSINELILTYWRFAKTCYLKDGQPPRIGHLANRQRFEPFGDRGVRRGEWLALSLVEAENRGRREPSDERPLLLFACFGVLCSGFPDEGHQDVESLLPLLGTAGDVLPLPIASGIGVASQSSQ